MEEACLDDTQTLRIQTIKENKRKNKVDNETEKKKTLLMGT